jgi:uncharacterized protein involved in copper resistance
LIGHVFFSSWTEWKVICGGLFAGGSLRWTGHSTRKLFADLIDHREVENCYVCPSQRCRWHILRAGVRDKANLRAGGETEGIVTNGISSDGDHEILYDRPIPHMRYFDWQAGVRLDLDSGPTRAWAAIGVQGLAPYFFNFAPTFYVRDGGRVAGRIQGSYDLYLSQRLILQPQVEMNFYSQADPARGIGSGFSGLDSGVRLAYQFSRKFAPYIGYTYTGVFGQTAAFSRHAVEATSAPRVVFGIWLWH